MTEPDDGTDIAFPAWGYPSPGDPDGRRPRRSSSPVLSPDRLTPGPRLLVPALELALLIPLIVANPRRLAPGSRNLRALSMALIGLVNAANAASLILLVRFLLDGGKPNGRELIYAGVGIWVTQVLVWSLWYWELDRGGPVARCSADHGPPDFLFPQMGNPAVCKGPWAPRFLDYLYVSLTNSTASARPTPCPSPPGPSCSWAPKRSCR